MDSGDDAGLLTVRPSPQPVAFPHPHERRHDFIFEHEESLEVNLICPRRRDVFVFLLALIVINFAVFSLKNAPIRLDRAGLSAVSLLL